MVPKITLVAPERLFRLMTTDKLEDYRNALVLDRRDDPTNFTLNTFVDNRLAAIDRILTEREAQ